MTEKGILSSISQNSNVNEILGMGRTGLSVLRSHRGILIHTGIYIGSPMLTASPWPDFSPQL